MKLRFKLLPLVVAVNFALNPSLALATEQTEKITVTGVYTVGENIDTATGLGLSLRETPQSVSVMTAQRIKDQAFDSLADVAVSAVGISVKEVDNVRNTFQARSLAGDSGETITDVSIYDRIEFVRGATGLLTGAGDPSASINLVRKHADSAEFEGYLNSSIGSWNKRQLTADLASGLNEAGTIRARVVAKYQQADSFLELYQEQTQVFYGVVEADLSPDTLLRVGASQQKNTPTSPTWGNLAPWYSDGSRTNWDSSTTTAADWTQWDTTSNNYFANLEHFFNNGWQLITNFNHIEHNQESKLLYLYGTPDSANGTGLNAWAYNSNGSSTQNSIDVRLKGDFVLLNHEHEFVVGALMSKQQATTNTFAVISSAATGDFNQWDGSYAEPQWATESTVAADLETEQKGLYAATRLSLSDNLKLITGARLSNWQRQGTSYGAAVDFGDNGVLVPYIGALYDLTADHRLYASYTEIFKPQTAIDRNGDFLDPLTGKSKEIGLKSTFLNDMLHTSVAIFSIDQDNLAQTDSGHFVPGTIIEASFAAQGTTSKGFEVEIVGQPSTDWNISVGYSQFNAEDAAGNVISSDHPRKQLKIFSTYQFSDQLQGLMIGGGLNWQSEKYQNVANPITSAAETLSQQSYSLVNLMARYDFNDKLQVQLNVENLFDKKYYSQVGFFDQYRYGAPRNVTLGLTYQL